MNPQNQARLGYNCGRYLRCAAISIVVLASAACAHADDPFGLGDAGVQSLAVLNLSDQFTLNGSGGAVNGNVGGSSAGGGSYNLTSPATINGQLITNSAMTGTNSGVPITGDGVNDTQLNGLLLADGNDVQLAPITLNGEVIGNQINLSSGTQINDPNMVVVPPVVPEPSSVVPMALGMALLGMIVVARKQKQNGFSPRPVLFFR